MNDDVLARLRQLGVAKGTRHLKTPPLPPASPVGREPAAEADDRPLPLDVLLPGGRLEESDAGACFVVDHVYPVEYRHGPDSLASLLQYTPGAAARYALDRRLDGLDFRDLVFLDTETTGLAGAGALAFMVGVAFFDRRISVVDGEHAAGEAFVVRQYFLRDHGDELAMLLQLDDLLAARQGLVTFNGRSFDVPLLDTRYLMNRLRGRLVDLPNLDLLLPARRLWRARLGSCALGALEQNLLGLRRTHEDVPGYLIPSLYHAYLRTGDARELTRVFYHNEIDMLSMVTLASRVFSHLERPSTEHALDLLSLARWQADVGLTAEAEQTLRRALDGDLPLAAYHQALLRLAAIYRQTGRWDEAVVAWQQLAFTSTDDVAAHVELAKHYEWRMGDPAAALHWTRQAIDLAGRWPPSARAVLVRDELAHRERRLRRKMGEA